MVFKTIRINIYKSNWNGLFSSEIMTYWQVSDMPHFKKKKKKPRVSKIWSIISALAHLLTNLENMSNLGDLVQLVAKFCFQKPILRPAKDHSTNSVVSWWKGIEGTSGSQLCQCTSQVIPGVQSPWFVTIAWNRKSLTERG